LAGFFPSPVVEYSLPTLVPWQVEGLPRERIVVGGFGMGGALALKTAAWMGLQVPLVLFLGGRIGTNMIHRVGYKQFIKRPTSCRLVKPQFFGSE